MHALSKQRITHYAGMIRVTARSQRKWQRYAPWKFYAFISPWLLGFVALTVFPLLYALMLSFTNFDGLSDNWRWVGLKNYVTAFHDQVVWISLWHTFVYVLVSVPLSIAGALGLALLLNQRLRAVGVFRTIFYLPSIVPVVASTIMFRLLFDQNIGVVNTLFESLKWHDVFWLSDANAIYVLVLLVLWGMGGGMVIFLAGLQGIPQEMLEAASVDGATALQRFWLITLPLLSPIIFFQVVVGVIFSLQTLAQPILLNPQGGLSSASTVPQSTYLYMVHVYVQFFSYNRYGYGSALLWLLFAVILIFTLILFRSSSFWVYYEVDRDQQQQ